MKKHLPFFQNFIILSALLITVITACKKTDQPLAEALKRQALKARSLSTADGLIAYWPLNGNAIDVIGSHTSTSTNVTSTTDRLGNPNGAMLFDGSSSNITIADATDLRLQNTDYTISVWARVDNTMGLAGGTILSKRGTTYPYGGYMVGFSGYNKVQQNAPGVPRYYLDGTLISDDDDPSGNYFGVGEWHNYIVSYHASTQALVEYFDGSIVANTHGDVTPYVSSPSNTGDPLILGFDQATGVYFKGAMSDLRIYNRELTEDEISELNGNPPSYQSQTTFYYGLSESASPISPYYVDGNLQISVAGNLIANQYWAYSAFTTINVPWNDVPNGTPFTITAYVEPNAQNPPGSHIALNVATTAATYLNTAGQEVNNTLYSSGGYVIVINQAVLASAGTTITYNGMIFDSGAIYSVYVSTY